MRDNEKEDARKRGGGGGGGRINDGGRSGGTLRYNQLVSWAARGFETHPLDRALWLFAIAMARYIIRGVRINIILLTRPLHSVTTTVQHSLQGNANHNACTCLLAESVAV